MSSAEPERRKLATCLCGAMWGGRRTSHCTACHNTFTGPTAFDQHRPGQCDLVGLVVVRESGNQQVWGCPDHTGRWGGPPRSADPVERRPAELGPDVLALLVQVSAAQAELGPGVRGATS